MADPKDNLNPPWPKGFCPNPGGRPKMTPEERQMQKWSKKFINKMINEYGQMTADELRRAWEDPDIAAHEKLYIKVILTGLDRTKDAITALEFMLKYTIGPPKEEHELQWKPSVIELSNGNQLVFKRSEDKEE